MGNLTETRIKKLGPGVHGDGATLYLKVRDSGAKSWVQRLVVDGKRKALGLGPHPSVSLLKARAKAAANRRALADGVDLLADRRKERMPTFREAATATFDAHKGEWKGGADSKTGRNWLQGMNRHVYPKLGRLRIDQVTRADVLAVLTPIWAKTPEVARKQRAHIKAVFQWAIAHQLVDANPAGEALDGALPRNRRTGEHYAAPHFAELAAALERLDESDACSAVKLCLRFMALCAVRGIEARQACWDEIDLERRTWTIPASKMKADREHRVPLSDAAIEVLKDASELRERRDAIGYVFPSPRGGHLSDNALSKRFRDMNLGFVPHGFRSCFRDWCGETGKAWEVAEAALAHVRGGVEGAYFRSDLFDRRRALMNSWAHHLTGASATVHQLRA